MSNLHQVSISECGAALRPTNLNIPEMKAALCKALPDVSIWCDEDGETWFVTRRPLGEGDTEEEAVRDAYSKLPFIIGSHQRAAFDSRVERQAQVGNWCELAFGSAQTKSIPHRGIRLLEEADETAQAAGVSREMAHRMVDAVWDRPIGELSQELGGVGVTVLALANAARLNADTCEENEVQRILSKPLAHFTARNQAKNDAGFLAVEQSTAIRSKR